VVLEEDIAFKQKVNNYLMTYLLQVIQSPVICHLMFILTSLFFICILLVVSQQKEEQAKLKAVLQNLDYMTNVGDKELFLL
jgi:hypothetical protein